MGRIIFAHILTPILCTFIKLAYFSQSHTFSLLHRNPQYALPGLLASYILLFFILETTEEHNIYLRQLS